MKKTLSQTLLHPLFSAALVTSSVLFLSGNSALAQEWRVEPTMKVGGEYDDNATLNERTDLEVELEGYLLDLRADIRYRSPKSSLFVQPKFVLRKYPNEPDFDSDDIFLRSNYRYIGAVNTLGVRANYDRQSVRTAERSDGDLEIDDPDEITDNDSGRTFRFGKRDKWRISPYWQYELTEKSTIGADFDYIDARYSDVIGDLLVDYTDMRLSVNFRRSISPITTGVITFTGRQYESGSGDRQNSIDGVGALVGFDHELSEKVKFSAMIGLEDTDQAGPDTDPEVVGFATLVRNLKTIRMFAQYRRSISASGASRLEIRDTINFKFSRRLNEKISAGLGVRAYESRGKGSTGLDSDRQFIQLQASLAWFVTRYFSIESDYRYSVMDRGTELQESSNSNRVNLWFVYRPNWVPEI
jgi:hypothetical protein